MAIEIERKYLVNKTRWQPNGTGIHYRQGYLCSDKGITVRVRIAGERAFITVKGPSRGYARAEYEYPLPVHDAEEMLAQLCPKPLIEKIRYRIEYAGHTWEVDVFEGDNRGLILAEIELPEQDTCFDLPDWLGKEVSGDSRYFNSSLAVTPQPDPD
jgi:CYTH domain-containing protein